MCPYICIYKNKCQKSTCENSGLVINEKIGLLITAPSLKRQGNLIQETNIEYPFFLKYSMKIPPFNYIFETTNCPSNHKPEIKHYTC